MRKNFQKVDFKKLFMDGVRVDHKIGEHVILMDEYNLNSVKEYSFVAPMNVFTEVLSGKGHIIVDGNKHEVNGHSLITYLKGQSVQIKVTSKRTIQRGAIFSDEFMEDMYRSAIKFNDIRASILMNPVASIEEDQSLGLDLYVKALRSIAVRDDNPNNLMCAKLATLALFYGPLYDVFKKKMDAETTRVPSISSRFFSLLEKEFMTKHNLSFYADRLNISKSYLHECIVSASGKPPGYWVDYYLTAYAKKNLADMDLSIQQIALSLNFAGIPQFSKFFKKQTGQSPSAYRKSLL